MKYNVKFTLNDNPKFEVVESASKGYEGIYAILKKKYKDDEIKVQKVSEYKTALAEVL